MDRRAAFFMISAVVCALLLWPTPDELRWVGITMTVTFFVLSVASWADHRTRSRGGRDKRAL